MSYKQIVDSYSNCTNCINCQNKIKIFGNGSKTARIAVVGEAPELNDITELTPFVGTAGQLLRKILGAVDLSEKDLYFTNAILCRTNDKERTPTQSEYTNCRKRLFEELSILKPTHTLLVGNTALKSIMGNDYDIFKWHGQWVSTLTFPCYFNFPIFHPNWILNSVDESEKLEKKKIMWEDIKTFRRDLSVVDMKFSDTNGV